MIYLYIQCNLRTCIANHHQFSAELFLSPFSRSIRASMVHTTISKAHYILLPNIFEKKLQHRRRKVLLKENKEDKYEKIAIKILVLDKGRKNLY